MNILRPFLLCAALATPTSASAEDTIKDIRLFGKESDNSAPESTDVKRYSAPDYSLSKDPSTFEIYDAVKIPTGILLHVKGGHGYRKDDGWGNDFFIVTSGKGGTQEAHQLYGRLGEGWEEFEGLQSHVIIPTREFSIEFNRSDVENPSVITKAVCWDDVVLEQERLSKEETESLAQKIRSGEIPLHIVQPGYYSPNVFDLNDGRHVLVFEEMGGYGQFQRFFVVDSEGEREVSGSNLYSKEGIFAGYQIEGVGVVRGYEGRDVENWPYAYTFEPEGGDSRVVYRLSAEEKKQFQDEEHSEQSLNVSKELNPSSPKSPCPGGM